MKCLFKICQGRNENLVKHLVDLGAYINKRELITLKYIIYCF